VLLPCARGAIEMWIFSGGLPAAGRTHDARWHGLIVPAAHLTRASASLNSSALDNTCIGISWAPADQSVRGGEVYAHPIRSVAPPSDARPRLGRAGRRVTPVAQGIGKRVWYVK
jgi:hypothetical protein